MSKSVIIAIVAVSIVFLERLILGIAALSAGTTSLLNVVLTGGISALILAGIITGNKLAWQWGQILGIIGAVILSITAIAVITNSNPQSKFFAYIIGSQAILLFILFFALGMENSKKYFKLVCPKCNSTNAKAANFFFTTAKCKDCNNQW